MEKGIHERRRVSLCGATERKAICHEKSEDNTTAKKKKSIKINSKEFKALSPEQQRILELEQQLRYAEIEIRFLKELRRLRLEDARKTKESQESSVISEETTP